MSPDRNLYLQNLYYIYCVRVLYYRNKFDTLVSNLLLVNAIFFFITFFKNSTLNFHILLKCLLHTPFQHLILRVATTSELCAFIRLLLPIVRTLNCGLLVLSNSIMFIENLLKTCTVFQSWKQVTYNVISLVCIFPLLKVNQPSRKVKYWETLRQGNKRWSSNRSQL